MKASKPKVVKNKLAGLTICKLEPNISSHVSQIVQLDAATNDKPWTMEQARKELTKKHVFAYGAYLDDRLVGLVVVHRRLMSGQIAHFLVLPSYQRIGVGRAMLRYLDSTFLTGNIQFLEFLVDEKYDEIHRFLKACDMKATDVLEINGRTHYLFTGSRNFSGIFDTSKP